MDRCRNVIDLCILLLINPTDWPHNGPYLPSSKKIRGKYWDYWFVKRGLRDLCKLIDPWLTPWTSVQKVCIQQGYAENLKQEGQELSALAHDHIGL